LTTFSLKRRSSTQRIKENCNSKHDSQQRIFQDQLFKAMAWVELALAELELPELALRAQAPQEA
jgi:hypothetical protein